MKKVKFTFEQVKDFIEKEGYVLLSNEYKNNLTKLKILCNNNHIFEMTRADFQQGHRCPVCNNCKKHTIEELNHHLNNDGYTLKSTEYESALSKIVVVCPNGHEFNTSWNRFISNGYRCPVCAGNVKLSFDNVNKFVKSVGYELVSTTYISSYNKLRFQCPQKHQFEMKYNNFKYNGQRCPICRCMKDGSKPEKEIVNYIKTIYDNKIIENTRRVIKNYWTNRWLELDIYLPECNKAIEFNGTYWHNIDLNKKWLDEIKMKQCKQKGIGLLVIKEDNWRKNKDKCLEEIKNFINK